MSDKKPEGCTRPSGGPVLSEDESGQQASENLKEKNGGTDMRAMVGKEAPDFDAAAFHEGAFKNIKLSDFRGKWVFLCFYPGDFTFV